MNHYARTFLFEENNAFCDHDRNVPVYVAFAFFVKKRNGNIRVRNAGEQANTENTLYWPFH
jgi:hypothetical protein